MANIIKIKRSAVTATPTLLAEGELAYSELSGNLFIGTNGGNLEKIGGNTDVLKLGGIEAGAQVNTVDSVNGATGVVSLGLEDLDDISFAASPNLAVDDLIVFDGVNWINVPKTDVGVTSHNDLTDIGSNSHIQIDNHIDDTSIHFTQSQAIKDAVRVATTVALPTYIAAGSGIGKTLTSSVAASLPDIDGVPVTINDRILVKNESNSNNGIYVTTATGVDGGLPEITEWTFAAASAATASNWFGVSDRALVDSYVWFSIDGSGTDPLPAGRVFGQELAILSSDTAEQVADKLVLLAQGAFSSFFNTVHNGNGDIVLTSVFAEEANDSIQGTSSTGFVQNLTTTQQGVSGPTAQNWVLTRAEDFDEDLEAVGGALIVINEGVSLHDQLYMLTTNDPIVIDTTTMIFGPVDTSIKDHDDLLNNGGVGSHAAISAHMSDGTIHYTQASISITKSQVSDFTETDYVHTTGAENIAGAKTFTDDMIVNGDLSVNGTLTTINSEDLIITDNTITLNAGETGAGVTLGTSGILIDRGTADDTQWVWNEATDQWGYTMLAGSPPSGTFVPIVDAAHVHDASDITTGTFADARIAQSNVTQHEAAINHDALLNFVADEHIAHSGVTITGGEGLTGGGDITVSRTVDLDVNGLVAITETDGAADYMVVYDASGLAHKKILVNNVLDGGQF